MKLYEVGFSNFKGIGEEPIWLSLEKKINVVIGPNNAGKSSVLQAMKLLCNKKHGFLSSQTDHILFHKRDPKTPPEVSFNGNWENPKGYGLPLNMPKDGVLKCKPGDGKIFESKMFTNYGIHELNQIGANILARTFPFGRSDTNHALTEIYIDIKNRYMDMLPSFYEIESFRKLSAGDTNVPNNGAGLVGLLARWKSPVIGSEADIELYNKVVSFLKRLVKIEDLELDIPPGSQNLIVSSGGLRLPIDHYGTGIHQLIILAINVLKHDDYKNMIGIEEPEIHLHPLLQKELLRFLINETKSRYLITTHSPSFLSYPNHSHIVRIFTSQGVSKGETIKSTEAGLELLKDLGISAADIMQSRFAIWIEGPSDAIYLRRWLEIGMQELNLNLIEGIDYSFVMYGGKCLSHFSMGRVNAFLDATLDDAILEEDVEGLVNALQINQHAAIIIDSDYGIKKRELNDTKKRIISEADRSGILCWVTNGREIENYLSPKTLDVVYGGNGKPKIFGKFTHIENYLQKNYKKTYSPKTASARKIVNHINDLDVLDLREKIYQLIRAIKSSEINALEIPSQNSG